MFRRFRLIHGLIAANLLMLAVLVLKFSNLPPQIPLFYSKAVGEDQLADTWLILILPFFMNFLYFLNIFLNKKLFESDEIVKKVFNYLDIFIIVSFTFIFAKIVLLVT